MYIARLLFPVKVLGPGNRIGIWMSGCGHKCAGCSNPELWEQREQQRITLENLKKMVDPIFENYEVDGVTLTGGDPFFQAGDLEELLAYLSVKTRDILVYTGYEFEQIRQRHSNLLQYISVIVDGKYIEELNHGTALRGSDNQKIIFLDESYRERYAAYLGQGPGRIQNFAMPDGIVSVGIHMPGYEKKLKQKAKEKGLEEMQNG